MRALVIGALLLRTLHAQDFSATSDDSTAVAEPAPLLTPGPDEPAEADIVSATSDVAIGDSGAGATASGDAGSADLPVGTADVIVEPTPTGSDFVWPTAEGDISTESSSFVDAEATSTDDLSSMPTPNTDAVAGGEVATTTDDFISGSEPTTTDDAGFDTQTTETPVIPDFGSDVTKSDVGFGAQDATDDFQWADTATATNDQSTDTATTTDDSSSPTDYVSPSNDDMSNSDTTTDNYDSGEASSTAEADASAATDSSSDYFGSAAFPGFGATATDDAVGSAEATGTPGNGSDVSQPFQLGNDASVTLDPAVTPTVGLSVPDVTLGASNGSSAAGVGAQGVSAASPQSGGSDWSGEDAGNYDGQDYGDDGSQNNEECPASCYDSSSTGDDADSLEAEDDGSGDYRLIKKFFGRFRRRQNTPSSGGFASFQWPTKKQVTNSEDCNPDIPAWLYQSTGRTPTPCKPKCPASCYASSSSDAPTESSAPTSSADSTDTDGSSNSDDSDGTSGAQDDSEDPIDSDGSMDTDASPVIIAAGPTPTTFATSASPAASPAGFTGATLDTICPKTCTASNPATNKCDITSSCTTTGGANTYCACRAGFRPSEWNAKDISKMFKVSTQPYVYIAEGVVCDMVCSDLTCSEVLVRPACA
jgi:hypothetical protein